MKKSYWVNWGMVLIALGLSACATSGPKQLSAHEHAALLVDAANGALTEGDPTGALQSLAEAEQYDDTLPELYLSRAIAYQYKHDLKTAIFNARKAIELKPDYSEANNALGKLLLDDGRYDEAESPLTKAAKDPLYRDAYKANTNLGILYYRRGNYEKAENFFDRAVEESPIGACVAYYYRGHIDLSQGRLDDAVKEYDHATRKICAGFADAHLALGIAYERSKQYDLARKKFLDIKQSFPNTKVAEQAMDRLRYLP